MIIQARFGAAQTSLGYQFYDVDGALLGSRITAGIDVLPETGAYIADATVPGGAVGVFWDSAESQAIEDLREALLAHTAADAATAVWAVSTRTLSSFGTLVADVATAVWAAGSRTLSSIADSTGVTTLLSRIASALTITSGKVTVGTNDDKTGYALATTPPTASAVASQVRTELTTELGRIDAAISSRNATAPDNAGIAAAKAVTDKLDTALELDGSVYRFTTNALEQAPSGSVLSETLETGVTVQQALRAILATLTGKATGGGTSTIAFRNPDDSVTRVTLTVDASGNRSAVVLNV